MPFDPDYDLPMMRLALDLAKRGWGRTHPNPMVGAVIMEQGRAVAEGWHERAGGPHAEVAAFQNLGHRPRYDATLYVTLEPCSTVGRTGACTDLIIERGIKRVVIGAVDPNPAHAGRGIEILREAGVEVIENVLAEECAGLNLIFNHWIVNQSPLFAAKVAMTLDGKIATRTQHSKWVTGEEARADVMRWRRLFPGIAVGAGTVLADDPSLTARLPNAKPSCPVRFIFDRHLKTVNMPRAKVFTDEFQARTVVVTSPDAPRAALSQMHDRGIRCWELPNDPPALYYKAFEDKCVENNVTGILFEGGSGLLSDMLCECRLDYLFAYRAPKLLADSQALPAFRGLNTSEMDDAIVLENIEHAVFGPDILTRGYIVYPE
ncbi:MAG: bifunctional diaminohydroxyphosphoribosylaminopyrimidine deaminase/5-amino-6-(5-phosphoribosylamino)uracil reductase RibD [Puniceicoccales bacterium]